MASNPTPFRLPDALLQRLAEVSKKTGLKRSEIVRLSLLRVLEIAEKDPKVLMGHHPDLLATDGRRSESMTAAMVDPRLNESGGAPAISGHLPSKKVVSYRKAIAADRRKKKKKS